VDRLEKLHPVLKQAGYSSAYSTGPGKQHGCLISYKKDRYSQVGEVIIEYDKQEVREDSSHPAARIGSSRVTNNIGFIVALAEAGASGKGVIVATTHLFWHPALVLSIRFIRDPVNPVFQIHVRENEVVQVIP
jgi:RNA exonuclease NGL2